MYNSMIFITLTSTLVLKIEKRIKKKIKMRKKIRKKLSLLLSVLTTESLVFRLMTVGIGVLSALPVQMLESI